jgi:hypothetical protein
LITLSQAIPGFSANELDETRPVIDRVSELSRKVYGA